MSSVGVIAAPSGAVRPAWRLRQWRAGAITGALLVGAVTLAALLAPWVSPYDPFAISGAALEAPGAAHLMGTDPIGRDVFSGVLAGARTSLGLGLMVVLPATLLGALVGLVSGYRGGIVDDVLMRFTEMFQVLPRFFLALVAVAILGPGLEKMALVLIITSWPVLARVVRGEVMALRSSDFVVAAYATGASPARVLLRQVLPNVVQPSLVVIGLLIGQLLLVEGSLGFLGLGDPDAISWGSMVGKAHGYLRVAWWVPVFPGAAIAVAVLGFNLLAEGVGGMLRRDGAQGAPSSRT